MVRPLPSIVAFMALALAGCGGGGGGGSHHASGLTISATTSQIQPGATVALTAFVNGGGTVTWSVDGGSANGTVTSSGVYTAPATQGTYTVRATVGDLAATKAIAVTNGIAIALTSTATPPLTIPKSQLVFAATVTGAPDKTVLWSVTDASNNVVTSAIASDGTFTAPTDPGTYTVVGTAEADSVKRVSATVQVVANANVRLTWTTYSGLPLGDVVFSLLTSTAPNTSANFVTLIDKGFYTGLRIHREQVSVLQFGSPLSRNATLADLIGNSPTFTSTPSTTSVPYESSGQSNLKYTLGAASTFDGGPAGDQVYINVADNPGFDNRYDAFGKATTATQGVIDTLHAGDTITAVSVEAGS